MNRPHTDHISLIRVIKSDVIHVRGIKAHIRMLEWQRNIHIMECFGGIAGLKSECFQNVEDFGDSTTDGGGTQFVSANGKDDADTIGEMGGAAVVAVDKLRLGFVPEDVDRVIGDEGAIEEGVGDTVVSNFSRVKEGEGGGGGEGGFADCYFVGPFALGFEGSGVIGEDGGVTGVFVCCYDEAWDLFKGAVEGDVRKDSAYTLQHAARSSLLISRSLGAFS